ncbi:MAG: MraY family glycosyltransferase [Polaribacter sp.]|nr:MraY family glycosyltransferase [Polaribacter sp.]
MDIFEQTFSFSIYGGIGLSIIIFTFSLAISYLCYPVIIKISKLKNLMSDKNFRSVHTSQTSNLGGIGIFIAIYLAVAFFGNQFDNQNLIYLLGAISIMFFMGLADDLINLKAKSKIIVQFIATLSLIITTNLRIENLHGFLGIYELPFMLSVLLTSLFFLLIINSFNLIDGVDGLAGSFAITVTSFFGYNFYVNQNYSMFCLSIIIIGSLLSFLIFNFSKRNKIFMGDTGSMVIGFLLAYQVINFINIDFHETSILYNAKVLLFSVALFSFPLLDTIRVVLIRIKAGKNPFVADKNHIHHRLLECGLSHKKISLLTSIFTIITVSGIYLFQDLEVHRLTLILLTMWFLSAVIIGKIKRFSNVLNRKTKIDNKNISKKDNLPLKGKVVYMNNIA